VSPEGLKDRRGLQHQRDRGGERARTISAAPLTRVSIPAFWLPAADAAIR
jgi:hypothetical protein